MAMLSQLISSVIAILDVEMSRFVETLSQVSGFSFKDGRWGKGTLSFRKFGFVSGYKFAWYY